jgi:hypothetical protein
MFSIDYDLYCISSHRPFCYPVYKTRNQFSSNAVEFVGNAKALSKDLWSTR